MEILLKNYISFYLCYNKIIQARNLAILYGSYDIIAFKKGKKILEYEIKEEIKSI